MRQTIAILIGVVLLSAVGCDGHVRLLYLQKLGIEKPPWSVASTTIVMSGDEDIPRLVSHIAEELGLTHDVRSNDYTIRVGEHGSFTMSVSQEKVNRWVIRLLDWPSFTRSQKSIDVEKALRAAIDLSNKASAR